MLAQRRGNYLRTLLLILLVVQVCVLLVYFRSFAPQWFTTSDQVPDSATKSSNRDDGDSHLWKVRQNAVKTAFRRAWDSYSHDAWGKDEYHSQSRSGINLSPAGYGFTIVDTLDTLLLMGLHDEFAKVREYVKHNLTFYQPNSPVSTFETTIRVLGGLLSAHYLTHTMLPKDERSDENAVFLERAVELADELVYSFNTPTGLPREKTYLQSAKSFERLHSMPTYEIEAEHGSGGTSAQRKQHKDTYSVCAVGGTMQLELEYLSHLTKNATYAKTARRAYNFLTSRRSMDGIQPLGLDVLTGEYDSSTYRFTIGAEIDSYYEYMIKQHLMFNGTPSRFKRDFDRAVAGVRKHLVRYTSKSKHVYVTELTFSGGDFTKPNAKRHELNQMGHLACYFPAALILSATGGKPLAAASMAGNSNSSNKADSGIDSDLDFARELLRTCVDGTLTPVTGLAPEMWRFVSNVSRSIAYGAPHLRQHLPALPATAKPGQNSADPPNPAKSINPPMPSRPLSLQYPIGLAAEYDVPHSLRYNSLRPETLESLFYMWRATGDPQYREQGWQIFKAFERFARIVRPGSATYTETGDVFGADETRRMRRDKMESFFLAETLKYAYLLFGDDDVLPLDQIVLNTEAHPFPVIGNSFL